jgi:copper(I)-binding protein
VNEINISPKSTLELKPGQLHLMLMNPIKEINENEPIELMIYFKKDMNAEILRIEATVLRNGYE